MGALVERAERLLRWSEKYMKTDMVYLAKGGFWLALWHAASTASGLLLVIGFANLLPKEAYGTYKYVLSIAGVVAAFSLTGMGVAVTQAVARGMEGVLRAAFRVQLRWSLPAALAAGAVAVWYALRGDRTMAISFLVVGAFTPIIESASLYADYLNGKKDFRASARYGILRSVVPVATLLATMAATDDIVLLVLAYFLSHAAVSAALYLRVLAKYRPAQEVDPSSIGFGKHVSLMNVLSIAAAHVDKVLVFHYLGAAELAAYSIAFSLPAQMKAATKTLNTLVLPKMSAVSVATIRSAIWPKVGRLFLAYGAVIALYIMAAPFLFRLLFPLYVDAIVLSQALALGYIFSPTLLFTETFYAQKRQKDIYVLKIVGAVSRILLLLLLLPPYGVWGAAAGFFLANGIGSVAAILMFRRIKE